MSEEQADAVLEDDVKEVKDLIDRYNTTKDINSLLHLAQKCADLADLYYEAMESYSSRFYLYKEKAGEYYEEISKHAPSPEIRLNSSLLSILYLMQAGKHESVAKKVNNLRAKQKFKGQTELSEDWIGMMDLMIVPSLKEAKRQLRTFKASMDPSLYKCFEKTFEVLEKMDLKPSIKETKKTPK
jgi:hypothetical protein